MESLAWVAAGSLLSTSIFLSLHVALDAIRARRLDQLPLVPNCLLTRYPLVFVTGSRSAFYFTNYWNQIPAYLAEHGYEVEVIELPWRRSERRLDALKAALVRRSRPCHLIGDSSIENELRAARDWGLLNLKSVTLVESADRGVRGRVRVADLRPRMDGLRTLLLSKESTRIGSTSVATWLQALLLTLHNAFTSTTPVVGAEVGLCLSKQRWLVERQFLDLAISLAEDDAQ
ncbi:MAG: hypothetical protein NDI61_13715 [Bdellovibrionaceae bacterium]|nr:hypothetical protein [Pseudobdellovibrionaceae bacterium]